MPSSSSSSRWTRRAAEMAVLAAIAATGATAALTQWEVACASGSFVVSSASTGLTLSGVCTPRLGAPSTSQSGTFDATDGVNLVLNGVTDALDVTFNSIGTLRSLTVTAGVGTHTPTVTVAEGISSSDTFYALSLVNVDLTSSTLSLGANVNYLSVEGSNATNIMTTTDALLLQTLKLGGTFSEIPGILYQANYNATNGDNDFTFTPLSTFVISTTEAQTLIVDDYQNLVANVPNLDDINVTCTSEYICSVDNSTSESNVDDNRNANPFSPVPGSSDRNNTSSSSSANSADVETEEEGGDGLSTVLIVIIIIVVLVALGLLFFIVRQCRARRAAGAANGGDDNTVTLMTKAETPGGGSHHVKGSFISSDEFLRTFRVEQSDVSLTKSLGTGRLWMGEYQGNKVIVKRIEAEVTEPFVTKEFRNQARTLATLNHPNIVSLVGVTWLAGTDFAVIAEFQAKGNLRSVLTNLDMDLDVAAKLQMCLEVARGLAYLHDPERNMCMKTLSSRKVLVGSSMACKLNVFECVSAGVKIDRGISFPYGMGEIAWLAPEVITRLAPMDARKANIFAFGVLACEVMTRAAPYQNMVDELGNTLSDVTLVQRMKDRRPLCPHESRREFAHAPQSLREAVDACLSYDTMSRPTAEQLVLAMERALEEARTGSI